MPLPPMSADARRSMAVRAGINQVACTAIGIVLWLFRVDVSLFTSLVFSLVIGNACWLFIDGGRALVGRWRAARTGSPTEWPGWAWMAPIVAVGTLLGYLLGHRLAKAMLGLQGGQGALHLPVMLFSLLAAVTISYLYYVRERLHERALQAAAAERAASELQLKLLQSQLEPHMLFNTLANLRVLIGIDPPRAQAMLDHLIAFLRATLASTRREQHALADEFAAIADYLALMSVRMGPRLRTRIELADDLRALPVPPLVLQPLVENAIRHGLEPQVDGGRIDIGARREGRQLVLEVRDTGAGLASRPPGDDRTSFGLEQVRARLRALHGDAATLTLQPATDAEGGTLAQVRLPLQDGR